MFLVLTFACSCVTGFAQLCAETCPRPAAQEATGTTPSAPAVGSGEPDSLMSTEAKAPPAEPVSPGPSSSVAKAPPMREPGAGKPDTTESASKESQCSRRRISGGLRKPEFSIRKVSSYTWKWAFAFAALMFLLLMVPSALSKTRPDKCDIEKIVAQWTSELGEKHGKRAFREYTAQRTAQAETIVHMRLNYFLIGEAFLFAALLTATRDTDGRIPSFVRLVPILGVVVTNCYWMAIVRAEGKLAFLQDVLDDVCDLNKLSRSPMGMPLPKPESGHNWATAWFRKSFVFIAWLAPAVVLWAWLVVLRTISREHTWFWALVTTGCAFAYSISSILFRKSEVAGEKSNSCGNGKHQGQLPEEVAVATNSEAAGEETD